MLLGKEENLTFRAVRLFVPSQMVSSHTMVCQLISCVVLVTSRVVIILVPAVQHSVCLFSVHKGKGLYGYMTVRVTVEEFDVVHGKKSLKVALYARGTKLGGRQFSYTQ